MLSSLNTVISTNESTRFIPGHVIYNPAYTYKFQLKTTLELAFDAEIVIFKFNEQESLGSWQAMIEKAKDFNASNYYTGETVTEIKEVVLAHDTSTVLTFNMDKKSQIIKQGILLIENITDVIMKDLKPECTLVSYV